MAVLCQQAPGFTSWRGQYGCDRCFRNMENKALIFLIHETVYYDDKSQGHESGLLLYTVISKHWVLYYQSQDFFNM